MITIFKGVNYVHRFSNVPAFPAANILIRNEYSTLFADIFAISMHALQPA